MQPNIHRTASQLQVDFFIFSKRIRHTIDVLRKVMKYKIVFIDFHNYRPVFPLFPSHTINICEVERAKDTLLINSHLINI